MGELIEAHFGPGLSSRLRLSGAAALRPHRPRASGLDLRYRLVKGVNGHVYAARQLSAEQRRTHTAASPYRW